MTDTQYSQTARQPRCLTHTHTSNTTALHHQNTLLEEIPPSLINSFSFKVFCTSNSSSKGLQKEDYDNSLCFLSDYPQLLWPGGLQRKEEAAGKRSRPTSSKTRALTTAAVGAAEAKPPPACFPSSFVLFSVQQLQPRTLIAVQEAIRLTLLQLQAHLCSSYRKVVQRKHLKPSLPTAHWKKRLGKKLPESQTYKGRKRCKLD